MIKRLRYKFVLINMGIVTAMLGAIFSLVIFLMGTGLEMQSQQMMRQVVERMVHPEVRRELPGNLRRPHFTVRMTAAGDVVVLDSGYFAELDQNTLLEYTRAALNDGKKSGVLRESALRFQVINGKMEEQIIIFADASNEIATMESLVKTCCIIGVISFGVFFLISILLARWAVKPVEKAWNQQRQFVADASHELKTPLTVIMTNADLLQSSDCPEDKSRFADSILAMSRQMRGLVEGLLELARVDNGSVKMTVSSMDFSELVTECLLPFEPLFFEKNLFLESYVEPGIWVRGSSSHLRQVVDILLDNAAKYSSPEGTIRVTLRRQGNHCILQISNPGETIGHEDLKNIFKRFYRIDQVRSMNHSYGLGLSIADSILREHGGKIWAESGNGINSFFVKLNGLLPAGLPVSGKNEIDRKCS